VLTLKIVAWKISKSIGVRISVANSRAMPLALYAKGEKERKRKKKGTDTATRKSKGKKEGQRAAKGKKYCQLNRQKISSFVLRVL
jgi:hypothetical protein